MTIRCTAVSAADALGALAAAVRDAKQGDPLAHVTIIVPTNAVGVTARRWLGANGGVAAIDLVTPARLAEQLAGAELAAAGRRPVSTPLIDIAVRGVLAAVPGVYESVARHPSTVTSLRDLHRELRVAGPEAAERLAAASGRGREAARVSSMVAERLEAEWFDEADLLSLAIRRLGGGDVPFERAVAFLPRPDLGLPAALLRAVGDTSDLRVLVETTGVEAVDQDMARFVAAIDADLDIAGVAPAPPVAADTVSTTDADDEVRTAVRTVVDAAREGIPFSRMAVVWPVDQPYARLVEHHLDLAGIPWNGRPGTLVTERLVPRFLLDLLDLDRRGLRRTDLFDFLADVPIAGPAGGRVSAARWERVARAAGVTREEHWQPRLSALAASYREQQRDRDADTAEQLAEFVAELRSDLGDRSRTRRWRSWVEWCERQVQRRLGRSVLDQLDEAERLASDHASKVLDRLRHLDGISGPVSRVDFQAAFAAEFEGAPGRLGRLGTGITVGSLAGTAGLDADLTIVLGAADGLLPPAPRTDPLVSDTDRAAAGLTTSTTRIHRTHRGFLGHLNTSSRVVVSTPRGDLRSSSIRLPSRWITDHTAGGAERIVNSHHAGLLSATFPAADTEHRLRARAAASRIDTAAFVAACDGDVVAQRALALRAARRSDRITVYDGDLSGVTIDHFERPISPSRIEAWPACPHGYFVRHVLGVRPLEEPDDEYGLSALEQGNVVHETLDRFHRLVIADELPQPGPEGWGEGHTRELLRLYDEVADEFERTGRTGRPAPWFLARRSVLHELLNWFVRDGRTAAARGARVIESELRFGYDSPVTLPLPDGRELAVAGFVDRIDECTDGGLVVMDHKSGRADRFKKIDAADPTEGGTKFQLPVYAAAALSRRGERARTSTTPVRAEYDFFERGRYERYGYTLDESVWARVSDDLGHVVDGIESGLYPAVTEPPKYQHFVDCWYCQPDGLGVDERYREWSAKQHDPRVAPWFADADEQGEHADGT